MKITENIMAPLIAVIGTFIIFITGWAMIISPDFEANYIPTIISGVIAGGMTVFAGFWAFKASTEANKITRSVNTRLLALDEHKLIEKLSDKTIDALVPIRFMFVKDHNMTGFADGTSIADYMKNRRNYQTSNLDEIAITNIQHCYKTTNDMIDYFSDNAPVFFSAESSFLQIHATLLQIQSIYMEACRHEGIYMTRNIEETEDFFIPNDDNKTLFELLLGQLEKVSEIQTRASVNCFYKYNIATTFIQNT